MLKKLGDFRKEIAEKRVSFRVSGNMIGLVSNNEDKALKMLTQIEARFQYPWKIKDVEIALSVNTIYI